MATAPDPRRLAEQARADSAKAVRWVIEVGDDKPYVFRMGSMTALDVQALRQGPGMTVGEALRLAQRGELDGVVALLWLARRQAGETRLTWEYVADRVSLDQPVLLTVEDSAEPDGEAHPDPQL